MYRKERRTTIIKLLGHPFKSRFYLFNTTMNWDKIKEKHHYYLQIPLESLPKMNLCNSTGKKTRATVKQTKRNWVYALLQVLKIRVFKDSFDYMLFEIVRWFKNIASELYAVSWYCLQCHKHLLHSKTDFHSPHLINLGCAF